MLTAQPHRRACPICDARPGRRHPWTFATCAECRREGCPRCVAGLFDGRPTCEDCRAAEDARRNAARFPVVPGRRTTPEDGEAWWVEMADGRRCIAHAYRLGGYLMLSVQEEHGPSDMSWDNYDVARYLGPVGPEPLPFPAADTDPAAGGGSC